MQMLAEEMLAEEILSPLSVKQDRKNRRTDPDSNLVRSAFQ
jgi:hypothetical protein